MSIELPPTQPTAVGDHDGIERVRLRLWQILASAITIAFTGWFCTMGVWPAVLSVFITKHILVAILTVGLQPPQGTK